MIGVYIHIPFCDHICYYCDFPKVLKIGQPVDLYLKCLLKEIKKGLKIRCQKDIKSIYIGGGTPSALSEGQLIYLLDGLNQIFDISQIQDFTIETNPNDLQNYDKLQIMYRYGIRRLSIGAQSFSNNTLKRIGRNHDCNSIIQAVHNAQKIGFKNISLDLMFRLPGQGFEEFKENISQALKLNVTHLSIYSLILEQHTVFHNLLLEHRLVLPTPENDRQMYSYAMKVLKQNGWHQYEISNFCFANHESLHNKIYWHNDDYYGFGAGAHAHFGNVRIQNKQVINDYIHDLENDEMPILKNHFLTLQEQIEEEMFLGLRLNQGVDLKKSSQKLCIDLLQLYQKQIKKLMTEGLIEYKNERIFLTENGRYIANDVFSEFLLG